MKKTRWLVALLRRTPAEWRAAVDRVESLPVRRQVASLIWWDFLSNFLPPLNYPHLRDLVDAWKAGDDADPAATAAGLVLCGYPRKVAVERSQPANNTGTTRFRNGSHHTVSYKTSRARARKPSCRGLLSPATFSLRPSILVEGVEYA